MPPYNVTRDMFDRNGVGVTVRSHESKDRTLVDGCVRGVIHVTSTIITQVINAQNTLLFCLNQSKKVRLGKFHAKRVKLGDFDEK